ncbi:MAG: methyltransferase domain-containing protein [Hyphomicrobium aestuarii]|nr:methyltransferase domain-containing protein [Hyphomicrobium aestuarii]
MDAKAIQNRNCPACDSASQRPVVQYSHPEWPIVECVACDFVYLKFAPHDAAFEDEYAWEKTSANEAKRRKKNWLYHIDYATRFRLKLGNALDRRFVKNSLPMRGTALDVGCGGACRVADGLTPFGIEISKSLAQLADPFFRERGGYVVGASAVDGLDKFDDQFFDHAILRSYLEHEMRPRLVLEKLYRKLKRGGTVAIKVPDYGCIGRHVMGAKWCGFRFPDHQNYFTLSSLTRLATGVGYTLRPMNTVPGLNDNLYVILIKPIDGRNPAARLQYQFDARAG